MQDEKVTVSLTREQWSAITSMAERGIDDAQYYVNDGWADKDDDTGKYAKNLESTADKAAEALQLFYSLTNADA
jgi:hypothetical protein